MLVRIVRLFFSQIYLYVHICICVTSKNISLTADVYKLLSEMKLKGESFSDTIRRLARRGNLSECAGLWADMPEEEFQRILEGIREAKASANESLRRRLDEGS